MTSRRHNKGRNHRADDRQKVSAKEELGDQFREAGSKRIREESWDKQRRRDEDRYRRARHDDESKTKPATKKKSRISKVLDWL